MPSDLFRPPHDIVEGEKRVDTLMLFNFKANALSDMLETIAALRRTT